jgi:hypothetical protein
VDGSRLIAQVEHVQSAGIADSGELITCLIDGSTGAVSETTGIEFATFVVANPDTGETSGIVALPSGVYSGIGPIEPELAASLPHFELDPLQFGGFRWVEKTDGLILITGQDGTLIGFPANAPNWEAVGTTPSTPVDQPDDDGIARSVDGPEGGMSAPAAADGRVFRVTGTGVGGNHLQIDSAHPGIGRADMIDGAISVSLPDGRRIKLGDI